jgi:hypothetical protein
VKAAPFSIAQALQLNLDMCGPTLLESVVMAVNPVLHATHTTRLLCRELLTPRLLSVGGEHPNLNWLSTVNVRSVLSAL